jgi:Werner syndrome ATP-dependent helicase
MSELDSDVKEYETVLEKEFNFKHFRDNQLDIIKHILNKKDVCAVLFTGAGKSLCFQYPAVYTNKITLVISPLISLMTDQELKLNQQGIPCCSLNSTISNNNKEILKQDIVSNKYRIVYTTPEYILTQKLFLFKLIEKDLLTLICVDESHVVSMWSHDFRTAYKNLSSIKRWIPSVPMLALTATATSVVEKEIISILKLNNPIIIRSTFDRPNLNISVLQKSDSITNDLLSVINVDEPTIVYCQTRKITDDISKLLENNKIKCESYHAGMSLSERTRVHTDFSTNKVSCITATVAFGMGIDITIRKVIHYGIPKNIESYYQEIGRAGRDGLPSDCFMFYSLNDINSNNYFLTQITDETYKTRMIEIALVMKNYIFSSECRRRYIINYFGEKYSKLSCNMCDNCLNKQKNLTQNYIKDFYDFTLPVFKIMNLTNNMYGTKMIIMILRASKSKRISTTIEKNELYGIGKHYSEEWWKILIRMLINKNYIVEKTYSGARAFTISISPKGFKVLKEKQEILLEIPKDMLKLTPTIVNDTFKSIPNTHIKLNTVTKLDINNTVINTSNTTCNKSNTVTEKNNTKQYTSSITSTELDTSTKQDTNLDTIYSNLTIMSNVKPKKGSSDQTLGLLKQGKTIKEIADVLNLKQQTIEEKIVKLYINDDIYFKTNTSDDIDLALFGFTESIYSIISTKIKELNYPEFLKPIKENLPEYSYFFIKLTRARLKKES